MESQELDKLREQALKPGLGLRLMMKKYHKSKPCKWLFWLENCFQIAIIGD